MNTYEINFDGIVGPTHHYGGLATGNLASQQNKQAISHPKAAALQGLSKMKLLADLGIRQAVLPPHPRPHWGCLKQHGMMGSDAEIIEQAARLRPDLLSIAYSSSAMWAANAATVSPSADTADGRVHFTPANLISTSHRGLESEYTTQLLRRIFSDHRRFVVYEPLPRDDILADEGAANQMRFCRSHGEPGVEVFVYGRDTNDPDVRIPARFTARQSRQAGERIAALHELSPERRLFVQQNPDAIDAGVFHNDVIAVGNENVLFCHERAFVNQLVVIEQLRQLLAGDLYVLEVSEQELSLSEAVSTYLFNSQLITLPGPAIATPGMPASMLLLCPSECETHPRARVVIDRILSKENPIYEVRYVDVHQSMRNGGGPACLRLRVVLTDAELADLQGNVLLTDTLYEQLCDWVQRHYREELSLEDLGDPSLAEEVRQAMDELEGILRL